MVLCNVMIKVVKIGKLVIYKLVLEFEVDFKVKKIFVSFFVGQGLLGKVVGEIVFIIMFRGFMEFEVVEILID